MKQLRQMTNWKVWYKQHNQTQSRYIVVTTDQDSEDYEQNVQELVHKLFPNAQYESSEMISTSFFI